jgi:hypothetical protein
MSATLSPIVIPGWPAGPGPESIIRLVVMDSGLAPSGAPRNDGLDGNE